MSLLRSSIVLALTLSLNSVTAEESIDNSPPVFSQGEPLLLLAEAYSGRRRGECEGHPNTNNAWTLNLCEYGPFCYESASQVNLWLPDNKRSGRTDRIEIRKNTEDEGGEERWDAGKTTFNWSDSGLSIESGMRYVIKVRKRNVDYFNGEIILYQVPSHYRTRTQKAQWMREVGCRSQANKLYPKHST
jgi:hypothetical protein